MEILAAYQVLSSKFEEKLNSDNFSGSVYLCHLVDDLHKHGLIDRASCEYIKNEITKHLIEKTGTHNATMFDCLDNSLQSVSYTESCVLTNNYRRVYLNNKIKEHSA